MRRYILTALLLFIFSAIFAVPFAGAKLQRVLIDCPSQRSVTVKVLPKVTSIDVRIGKECYCGRQEGDMKELLKAVVEEILEKKRQCQACGEYVIFDGILECPGCGETFPKPDFKSEVIQKLDGMVRSVIRVPQELIPKSDGQQTKFELFCYEKGFVEEYVDNVVDDLFKQPSN